MNEAERREEVDFLLKIKSGDHTAFRFIFSRYSTQIYRVAYHYLNNREESLEVVQEVFMKMWIARSTLIPESPIIPYLVRIAKNHILNRAKRKIIEKTYLQNLEYQAWHKAESLENSIHFAEVKGIVDNLVDQMPDKRREIFILSRNQGLTNNEIAVKMNLSERTVENQINKSLRLLKTHLRKLGYMLLLF